MAYLLYLTYIFVSVLCLNSYLNAGESSIHWNKATPADALRMEICINGAWEMAPGKPQTAIPTDGWIETRVPALPLSEADRPDAVWYRCSFDVPADWARAGRRFFLELEKVGHYVAVYCNGRKLGEHYGQYTPFEVELASTLKTGGRNEIAVFVHDASGKYVLPGMTVDDAAIGMGFRPAGQSPTKRNWVGIVGDVTFSWRPVSHIANVTPVTSFRNKTVEVSIEIDSSGTLPKGLTCRSIVLDGEKEVLTLSPVQVSSANLSLKAGWANPTPWMPPCMGIPKLYWLRTELVRDGQVIDRVFTRFGFREVWTKGKRLLLNGQRLWVVGNYNAWLDPLRYNNDRRPIACNIRAMQESGINALHGHWDDLGRPTMELCDEMGMLVVGAFYCSGQMSIRPPMGEGWPEWLQVTAEEWIKENRIHPSMVILRPVCGLPPGNIEKFGGSEAIIAKLTKGIRTTDETIPLCYGIDIETHSQGAYAIDPETGKEDRSKPGDGSHMAARAMSIEKPLLTNEIWWKFTPIEVRKQFFADFYRRSYEIGTVGFIVQHTPYLKMDAAWIAPELFRTQKFTIEPWPSQSGLGGRSTNVDLARGVNWCDATQPIWMPTAYSELFRELNKEALGEYPKLFPGKTYGDVLVSGVTARAPIFLIPKDVAQAPPLGVMSAADGTAWFLTKRTGNFRLVHPAGEESFNVEPQSPVPVQPGYSHIQRLIVVSFY